MKWIWVWFILWNVMFEVKNNWLLTAYSGIFGVSKTSRTLSELWKCDSECLSFFTFRLLFVPTLLNTRATFCVRLFKRFTSASHYLNHLSGFWTFVRQNFELRQLYCFAFFSLLRWYERVRLDQRCDTKAIFEIQFIDSKYNYFGSKIAMLSSSKHRKGHFFGHLYLPV